MLISMTMGVILAILGAVISFAVFYFLLKAMKAGQKAGAIVGSIAGLAAAVVIFVFAGRVIIVKGVDDAGTYLVYGTPTYEFSNGFKLNLTVKALDAYVINDSDLELVLEKVIYSTSSFGGENYYDVLCDPMSITHMPSTSVDYFFNDTPPDEIETSGSSSVTKYWLRTRDSYENEYGFSYYDENIKSISAQTHNNSAEE
jgi:hypothetical protein